MKNANREIIIDEILETYSEFEDIEDLLPELTSNNAFRKIVSAIYDEHRDESFENIRQLVHTISDLKDFSDEGMSLSEIKKVIGTGAAKKNNHNKAQELLREAASLMGLDINHFIIVRPDIRKKEQAAINLKIGQRPPHIEGETTFEYRKREGHTTDHEAFWICDDYISHSGTRGAAADPKRAANGMAVKMLFKCLPFERLKTPYASARDILKYCGFNINAQTVKSIAISAGYTSKKAPEQMLPNWP